MHERKGKSILLSAFAGMRRRVSPLKKAGHFAENRDLADSSYRAIFNAANDAIFVHDIETGAILDVNLKMCEMYGYRCDEVRRLSIEALSAGTSPYTQEDALRWVRKAAWGEPQLFEWLAKDKGGRLFWIEVSLKRASIGGTDRLLAIVRDISERKRYEEELKGRIDFIKLITGISTYFINLPVGQIDEGATYALRRVGEFAAVDRSYIFQFSLDGKRMDNTHEWCAEGIEPHSHRLRGLSVEDFSWLLAPLRKGEPCHVSRVSELPAEAAAEKMECELEGIQSLLCVPMIFRGNLIGFAGFDSVRQEKIWEQEEIALLRIVGEILSNALDRKRMEGALRESETRYRLLSGRLEEMVEQKVAELRQAQSLAAIGQMVSVVAHEVRNPLQSIKLGTDILHMELDENKSLSETLAGIDRGIETLSSIVTELLEYSKPVELQYSTRPVMALVEEALRLLSHKLRDITVSMELDQREREIPVDSMKFTAVLVNLISNAIEAMPNGGKLAICSRFFTENGNSVLKLSVTDNGCGIAEKDLQRVQEPFVTTKSRGTGLGLPICKKIVEAHRGSMQIQSRLNEGTVVEITVPAEMRSAS